MQQVKRFLKNNHFWLFVIAFIALFISVESNNDKLWTNDFKVYYLAAKDFFSGNNPYIHNYGLDTGYFKYPPFTLYLFRVFTFFNYHFAQLIHLGLMTFSLCYSFLLVRKIVLNQWKKEIKIGAFHLAFIFVVIHLVREFHMGNVNLYLMVLFLAGLNAHIQNKQISSAIYWSLMLILKPIMVLSLLFIVFERSWKTISYLIVLGIIYFLFPIISTGFKGNFDLWQGWLNSISSHGEYIVSENSLTYLTNYYFGIQSQWGPSILILVLMIGIFLYDYLKLKRISFMEWTIIMTAFSPNFFVTDTQHFLLSLPLILLFLFKLSNQKNIIAILFFSIAILLYSFNSNDLWGHQISNIFDAAGILGIGNLIMIVGYITISMKEKRP